MDQSIRAIPVDHFERGRAAFWRGVPIDGHNMNPSAVEAIEHWQAGHRQGQYNAQQSRERESEAARMDGKSQP